jgi:hypothetical protein
MNAPLTPSARSVMSSACARTALHEDAQILVNLGLVQRDGERQPYFVMRTQGRR